MSTRQKVLKRRRVSMVFAVSMAVFFSSSSFSKPADFGPKFFEPTEEVVTPHIKWAKPYSEGKIKALFIVPFIAMREVIELSQRLDLDYEVFAFGRKGSFNFKWAGIFFTGVGPHDLGKRLNEKLSRDYDLIVIGNMNKKVWEEIPLECRFQILMKVKQGTGLVGHFPTGLDDYLKKATSSKAEAEVINKLIEGFPFSSLEAFKKS